MLLILWTCGTKSPTLLICSFFSIDFSPQIISTRIVVWLTALEVLIFTSIGYAPVWIGEIKSFLIFILSDSCKAKVDNLPKLTEVLQSSPVCKMHSGIFRSSGWLQPSLMKLGISSLNLGLINKRSA